MANKYNYPCPVIGNQDDYKDGTEFTFSEDIKIIQHLEGIKMLIPLPEISEEEINNLFYESSVSLFLIVNCPSSYYQQTFHIQNIDFIEGKYEINLSSEEINKVFSYTFYLAAEKELLLKPYSLSDSYLFNEFKASKYDLLAKTETLTKWIDYDYDTSSGDQSGIILVTKNTDEKCNIVKYDYTQDKILIKLPSATWDCYQKLDESHGNILHSSMALPTLIGAINLIKDYENEKEEDEEDAISKLTWFKRIEQKIELDKLEDLTSIEIASAILENPIHRGINFLSDIKRKEKDQEEDL